MNFTLPTKHQVAVAGTHAVVGAGSALAALAYFGVLSPSDLQSATDDVKRIAADLSDLYAAVASLVVIGTTVFATVKSGPLASLFRAAASISKDPVKMAEVQAAPIAEKANVVAITDKMPEVAGVSTTPTQAGSLLASAVPSQTVRVVAKILIMAFALSLFLPMGAQAKEPKLTGNLIQDIKDNAAPATPAASTAPLPCMDITMLPKLTVTNLLPTMKACIQDVNNQLVTDTQRALDSAKAYTGSATGTAAMGDQDAINCLTPALALFKAAAIVPAVPEVPAVLNADGTVKTAAIPGTPELDPGPFLLGQKFREFTLAGGLTSCQAWINEPIQAVNAAAAGAVGSIAGAVAGAAILAPK